MAKWGTLEHPGDNDVRPTQNRVQPTASDSSDQLFFIRKMRCEGYAFGVKLSSEPHYAAAAAMRHARLLKIEPRWQKKGFEPPFCSTHSTLAVVQTLFAL